MLFLKGKKKARLTKKAKIKKNSFQLVDTRGKVGMRYLTRYDTRHGRERGTAKLQDLFVSNP